MAGTGIGVVGWGAIILIDWACAAGTIVVTGTWTYLVTTLGSYFVVATCLYLVTVCVVGAWTVWYVVGTVVTVWVAP